MSWIDKKYWPCWDTSMTEGPRVISCNSGTPENVSTWDVSVVVKTLGVTQGWMVQICFISVTRNEQSPKKGHKWLLWPIDQNLQAHLANCDAMFRNASASKSFPCYKILKYFLGNRIKERLFLKRLLEVNFVFALKYLQKEKEKTEGIICMEVKYFKDIEH